MAPKADPIRIGMFLAFAASMAFVWLSRMRARQKRTKLLRAMRLDSFSQARPDAFTWRMLRAENEIADEEPRGTIDGTQFLRELERFPWAEQLTTAQNAGRSSPTLTLQHGGHDRVLTISGVRYDDGHGSSRDGFLLFWGRGSTAEDPLLIPVAEMSKVRQITELFLAGQIQRLDRLFATHGMPMDQAFAPSIVPPELPDLSAR
jgi:hypothetical protein